VQLPAGDGAVGSGGIHATTTTTLERASCVPVYRSTRDSGGGTGHWIGVTMDGYLVGAGERGEDDDVVEVVAGSGIKSPAAGDQPQGSVVSFAIGGESQDPH
jgi:hypothetical protein